MSGKKRKPGRPKKLAGEKVDRSVYLRADEETTQAVEAYRAREDLTTMSEAVRRLVRKALKAEGLLK
jgi:hypothetical protein